MATKSFAKTFVDIDLDDANDISVNFEVEKNEEVIIHWRIKSVKGKVCKKVSMMRTFDL
ncbi:hypothetical protein Godav_001053 [Gossypium davidsonii]|uniref:Uncharacterized protein n=3 Tax=Gossypium TaxID=3633 RepID=A0A7J8T1Q7_GOSDV|nr:hypothetical protein [Gossypium davidsonii]MBA0668050.1 hypothetical protein [Gossypium klotzschianum]